MMYHSIVNSDNERISKKILREQQRKDIRIMKELQELEIN